MTSLPIGGVADAGEQLDRLVDLDRADAGAQHAQHAALGAAGHHARRRRLGVEAAVAGGVGAGAVLVVRVGQKTLAWPSKR